MRTLGWLLTLAVVGSVVAPVPGRAEVASIQTMAPVAEPSEQAIAAAVEQALTSAIRGAVAMGLPWVQLRQALVLPGMVTVQILASDTNLEEETTESPSDEPAPAPPRSTPKIAL